MDIPGEKLVIKLWETLADKGIGSLLKPWQIRREGRASLDVRRDEVLLLAQAESDAAAIRKGQKLLLQTGELVDRPALAAPPLPLVSVSSQTPVPALPYVMEVAARNTTAEEVRKEISVARAVLVAEAELQADASEPSPDAIDDDWLIRWRDCASSVSSEELQSIWGKVLAGEVKSPGQFSFRTLEFLRNLSQDEAKAIALICPFVIAGVIYRGADAALEAEGLTFSNMLAMQELGVLAGIDGLGLQISWKSDNASTFQKALTCHGTILVVTAADPNKVLTLQVGTVTSIGRQVLSLGSFSPNRKMIDLVVVAIKGLGFEVQLGSYIRTHGNDVRAFNLCAQ